MTLRPLLARLRGGADLVLALLALGVVSLLVAPLPPWVLDVGVAANLALAATVLLVALFARDVLRLASLPSLLLLTTLFRLALEVSATRLVLARGDAGRVIQAFGRVVVGGSPVVGAVIYAVVTLVQLLVVAKGAERVAEVAARFTLDALPGKQMAVDADLRAGAIDQAEARRRRRALEREGQLHGAMDGALKFVKGDALAGVAIVLVNVAGGVVAGLARGMEPGAAARRYALLAIGDGLAAQIPALLVSVAAGVAVTRVAAEEEGASLSEEMGRQLFTDPRALAAVAVLCGAMAVVPGLPAAPFAALALGAAGASWLVGRGQAPPPPLGSDAAALAGQAADEGPDAAAALVTLELAPDLAALARAGGDRLSRELLPALRAELARRLGAPLPAIALRRAALPPGGWRLLVDDVPASAGRAPVGEAIALLPPEELHAVAVDATAEVDPGSGSRVSRIPAAEAERAALLAPVRGPLERLVAALAAALAAHAHLFLGIQEVQDLLQVLERSHPALVREVSRQVPVTVLAEVLRQLLEEGIAIRPLRTILEGLLDGAASARSPAALAEHCRRALRRHIAHGHAASGVLDALLLDPAAEAALREGLAGASAPAIDPRAARALVEALAQELTTRADGGRPVLLTAGDLRRPLRQLLAARYPRLAVLSYEELPASLPVRPVGALALPP